MMGIYLRSSLSGGELLLEAAQNSEHPQDSEPAQDAEPARIAAFIGQSVLTRDFFLTVDKIPTLLKKSPMLVFYHIESDFFAICPVLEEEIASRYLASIGDSDAWLHLGVAPMPDKSLKKIDLNPVLQAYTQEFCLEGDRDLDIQIYKHHSMDIHFFQFAA